MLIAGSILAFSVMGTALQTPRLEEAVPVPVQRGACWKQPLFMHRRADLGACVANVQMESGKLLAMIKGLKAK